jgi:hypothetical protein
VKKRDEWLCGYAAALATIIRTNREMGLARIAMVADGLTLDGFKKAGVEEYDLYSIKEATKR